MCVPLVDILFLLFADPRGGTHSTQIESEIYRFRCSMSEVPSLLRSELIELEVTRTLI